MRQAALARLPSDQRAKVLAAAIESDPLTIACALSEPAFVTGMDPVALENLRLRWQRHAAQRSYSGSRI